MKDVTAKLDRAKALLKLVDKLALKLGDNLPEEERRAQAILQLDEKLGPEWRKEVKRAGLDVEEPARSKPDMEHKEGISCMYKKIKKLLEENGETEKLVDDGRAPLEEEDEEVKKIRVLILG